MAVRGRRRKAPVAQPVKAIEPEAESLELAPNPEDGEEAIEPNEPEQEPAKHEVESDMGEGVSYVALGRVRYTDTRGETHTVEPGEYLVSPKKSDLAELSEAGLIEQFESHIVDALKEAMSKNPAAVRKILGV